MKNKRLAQNFGQILNQMRQMKQMSQEELAHQSELDRTYISQLERGKKMPTIQTLYSLCRSLNVSPERIIAKLSNLEGSEEQSIQQNHSSVSLPIFGTSISCGKPFGIEHIAEKTLSLNELLVRSPGQTFFVKASGDSMAPQIIDGDYLVIDSGTELKNGSAILAQINNEFAIKRYSKSAGTITLASDNPNYSDITITSDIQFIYCGTINGVIRLRP